VPITDNAGSIMPLDRVELSAKKFTPTQSNRYNGIRYGNLSSLVSRKRGCVRTVRRAVTRSSDQGGL
jgi:hypothetical protein